MEKEVLKLEIEKTIKLLQLDLEEENATYLLLGTAAVESNFQSIQQYNGPAIGLFQMEPDTYHYLWDGVINRYNANHNLCYPHLNKIITSMYPQQPLFDTMLTDIRLAIIMARLKYYSVKAPIPSKDNAEAMGHYWKLYYNSVKGKGTMEAFIKCYQEKVL